MSRDDARIRLLVDNRPALQMSFKVPSNGPSADTFAEQRTGNC
jgi:hypothetical protein